MRIRNLLIASVITATPVLAIDTPEVSAASWRGNGNCQQIEQAFLNIGASSGVADRFAYSIAPRESGCRAQYVHDHDDWSYSRFGLNGKSASLRRYWMRLCGADVRNHTRNLSVDVRCAYAAFRTLGWRPWR